MIEDLHRAHFLRLARFEDLMSRSKMLVEVSNLLATFWAGIACFEMDKFSVVVMV